MLDITFDMTHIFFVMAQWNRRLIEFVSKWTCPKRKEFQLNLINNPCPFLRYLSSLSLLPLVPVPNRTNSHPHFLSIYFPLTLFPSVLADLSEPLISPISHLPCTYISLPRQSWNVRVFTSPKMLCPVNIHNRVLVSFLFAVCLRLFTMIKNLLCRIWEQIYLNQSNLLLLLVILPNCSCYATKVHIDAWDTFHVFLWLEGLFFL